VIHLACISNDPSFELDPGLGKSINYDAFFDLVAVAKDVGVRRFVYASSSSVYGVRKEENVTEELALEPLTDYSKYKAMCEEVLLKEQSRDFTTLVLRPATVCGYAPRLRLDLSVNILTNHAVNKGKITVFGGAQKRPNIHIDDMVDLYLQSLTEPDERIAGKIFNAGYENHTMNEIASIVKDAVGGNPEVTTAPTDDNRSYHISSEKIRRELGFVAHHTIREAAAGVAAALRDGRAPDAMTDARYYNIKTMQNIRLT
jgi:nucleoside-diphosphate-sugar epimerase